MNFRPRNRPYCGISSQNTKVVMNVPCNSVQPPHARETSQKKERTTCQVSPESLPDTSSSTKRSKTSAAMPEVTKVVVQKDLTTLQRALAPPFSKSYAEISQLHLQRNEVALFTSATYKTNFSGGLHTQSILTRINAL